jgi:hypothetical protein
MSNPGDPNPLPVQAVIEHLAEACHQGIHEFWQDAVSLLDSDVVDSTRIHGPRQLTDIYLLALAVQHEGRLVTFDAGIPLAAVRKATKQNLLTPVSNFFACRRSRAPEANSISPSYRRFVVPPAWNFIEVAACLGVESIAEIELCVDAAAD